MISLKGIMLIIWLCLALLPELFMSQEGEAGASADTLSVAQIAVCDSIVNRAPVGARQVFQMPVERLYCLTKIDGCPDTTFVTHIWFHGDKEMASVRLPVKSEQWRTWSSKRIVKDWMGEWWVQVLYSEEKLLGDIRFEIKE